MAGVLAAIIMMSQNMVTEEGELREIKFQGIGHKWSIRDRQYYEIGLGWITPFIEAQVSGNLLVGYTMIYEMPCSSKCKKRGNCIITTCDFQKNLGLHICEHCNELYFISVSDDIKTLLVGADMFVETHMDFGGF